VSMLAHADFSLAGTHWLLVTGYWLLDILLFLKSAGRC
jgi:hypothetical protein